jgi:hypothetical protein
MKITALEDIVPALTAEQWAAAGTITSNLSPHLGKWFLVEDFPGPAPALSRLKEALDYSVDTARRLVEIKPDGANYKVIIRELKAAKEAAGARMAKGFCQ